MTQSCCGELTRLANKCEADPEVPCEGRCKDESACLRRCDDIKHQVFNRLSEKTERGIHRVMI